MKKQIRAILIDDEVHCIETLKYEIQSNHPEIDVVETFQSPEKALEEIEKINPQLVFLDIEMPEMSGFEFLEKLPNKTYPIIFVTAYDQYALQAFRFAALDYLLKPVDAVQLKEAVGRFIHADQIPMTQEQINVLLFNLQHANANPKIALPSRNGLEFVKVQDIVRCNSDSNYTHIYLQEGKRFIVSRTLKELSHLLEKFGFLRIHQSHLINPEYISRYIRDDGGYAVMNNGVKIPISKRKKESFLKYFYNR